MKEKGIKILFSIFLFASILMPFSVSGESVGGSSPIIGVNITYIDYDGEVVPYQTTVHFDTEQTMWRCTSSHSTMGCQVWESENINGTTLDEITGTITTNATSTYTYRLYQYEFIFDKTYVGSITFNGNHPGATTTTTYYVNGNRLILTDINLVTSFTIGSYSLTYAPLEVINTYKQWNFPIYSLTTIQYLFDKYEVVDNLSVHNYYTYPVFHVTYPNGVIVQSSDGYGDRRLIIWLDNLNDYFQNTFLTHFRLSSGWSIASYERLYQIRRASSPYYGYILSLKIVSDGTSPNLDIYANQDTNLSVIYCGLDSNRNFDTDFALAFGLSNELLDNLDIIAKGTQQSQQAGSDLDNATSDMQSDFNSYYSIENSANSDFNSALNGINFNDQIAGNQSFLDSASFVKTVFSSMMQIPILSTFVIILCIVLMARIFL